MSTSLLNFLPPERTKALSRVYYTRLAVVVLGMVTALALVGAVLMIPTYTYLAQTLESKRALLGSREQTPAPDEPRSAERAEALGQRIRLLKTVAAAPSPSVTLREVLAVPHESISIFNLHYLPKTAEKEGTVMISGTAASRETLHAYQRALEATTFARTVDLPVAAYAKDTNIPFTITVSLTP
jgi:hypothetical protein